MSTSRGILPSYLGLCWCNPLCFSFGVDFSYALELCLNYIITLKNMLSSRGTVCLNCSSPASFFISTKMVSTSNYLRRRRWTKGRGWKILSRSKQPAAAAKQKGSAGASSSKRAAAAAAAAAVAKQQLQHSKAESSSSSSSGSSSWLQQQQQQQQQQQSTKAHTSLPSTTLGFRSDSGGCADEVERGWRLVMAEGKERKRQQKAPTQAMHNHPSNSSQQISSSSKQ